MAEWIRSPGVKGSKYIGLKRVSPHILNSMYGVCGGHRTPSHAYPSVFIWYSIFTFLWNKTVGPIISRRGPRSNLTTWKDLRPMTSYKLFSYLWVIWEILAICNTSRDNSHLLILSRWIISYGSETSLSESSLKSRRMSYLRKIGYLQYF